MKSWQWGGDINDNEYVVFIDGVRITDLRYTGESVKDAIANARLIAAAPELLEALKIALGIIGENNYIDSVIAKAEGV